jgi:hypothetical protein
MEAELEHSACWLINARGLEDVTPKIRLDGSVVVRSFEDGCALKSHLDGSRGISARCVNLPRRRRPLVASLSEASAIGDKADNDDVAVTRFELQCLTWRGRSSSFLEDCPDVLIKSMGVGSLVPRIG